MVTEGLPREVNQLAFICEVLAEHLGQSGDRYHARMAANIRSCLRDAGIDLDELVARDRVSKGSLQEWRVDLGSALNTYVGAKAAAQRPGQ
jgi:hypothetical protein